VFASTYFSALEAAMTEENETGEKMHYVCQTYVAKKAARGGRGGLQIGKQLQYSTASEAQNRAEREFLAENCIGADAYVVTEDRTSGEVGSPTFLVRLGTVPDDEGV
jgi:hypothetical protein